MFSKILIANRGEIALRIIRACREMGIRTAVVYSTADRDAAYLKLADQAICIGEAPDEKTALKIGAESGYPVIIKAAAGGGGRGMRVAHNDVSLRAGLKAAQAEAENAFKDSTVYIEKYVEFGRHVEVQILADHHGNALHLWERDCSMQRRHQRLGEESPSPTHTQVITDVLC